MISAQEFIARQDRLLAQCLPNSVCVIPVSYTHLTLPTICSV